MCSSVRLAGASSAISIMICRPSRCVFLSASSPRLDEVTGIPGEPGQVGHQAKRCQVKLPGGFVRAAKTCVEFFGEFIGNAGAG